MPPETTPPEPGAPAAPPAEPTTPPATPEPKPTEPTRLADDHPLVKAYADTKAKLKKREDADLSETERLTGDLATQTTRGDTAEARVALLEAAIQHGLTKDDLALLGGGSPEDIGQRAEALAKRIAGSEAGRKKGGNHVAREGKNPPTGGASDDLAAVRELFGPG